MAHSAIEAKVLSVRPPRRRNQGPPVGRGNQRRGCDGGQDGSQILPGCSLPQDDARYQPPPKGHDDAGPALSM